MVAVSVGVEVGLDLASVAINDVSEFLHGFPMGDGGIHDDERSAGRSNEVAIGVVRRR